MAARSSAATDAVLLALLRGEDPRRLRSKGVYRGGDSAEYDRDEMGQPHGPVMRCDLCLGFIRLRARRLAALREERRRLFGDRPPCAVCSFRDGHAPDCDGEDDDTDGDPKGFGRTG